MTNLVDKTIEISSGRFFYEEAGSGPARLLVHLLLTDQTSIDQITGVIQLPAIAHAQQLQDLDISIKATKPSLEGK